MKKIVSFVITSLFCACLCFVNVNPVYAMDENFSSEKEDAVSTRSIMHPSREIKCDDAPIWVTFVYGYQESTDEIIALDRAYISRYDSSVYSDVKIHDYGVYSGFVGFYAFVSCKYRWDDSYYSATASWYF